jgi:UDP-N-acetylmuramoylalanine--D-glutamate ligase
VISFWPDHLELHGTLDRYRAAKERIVRHQRPEDSVVVNADVAAAGFARATPAGVWEFSVAHAVERGAYFDRERGVVVADGTTETGLGHIEFAVAHPANVVAAAAIATAAGADPSTIGPGVDSAVAPPWRAQRCGTLGGVPVLDDGMAATPSKGAATLARYQAGSIVLIAGGLNDAGGGIVHATPAELALLEQACDAVARVARVVVLFGEAGRRLAPLLARRQVELITTIDLEAAVTAAAQQADRATAVVFAPLFPVALGDRERFGTLVRRLG